VVRGGVRVFLEPKLEVAKALLSALTIVVGRQERLFALGEQQRLFLSGIVQLAQLLRQREEAINVGLGDVEAVQGVVGLASAAAGS
jgi:hypothetical protein